MSRFLDQRRSVRSPFWWRLVFWIKGGQLDPPVDDVRFFRSKEVSWIPMLVTSYFWTKGCQFDSPVVVFAFLDHSWDPLRVVSVCLSFCNILSSPPIFQGLRLSVCNVSSSSILTWKVHFSFCDVSSSTPLQPGWAPQAQSKKLIKPQNCILAQQSILGLAGRRPALA